VAGEHGSFGMRRAVAGVQTEHFVELLQQIVCQRDNALIVWQGHRKSS
jgi:hypothetical protein